MCVYYCSKYYEKDSLVADPDYGSILSSLLGKWIIRIHVAVVSNLRAAELLQEIRKHICDYSLFGFKNAARLLGFMPTVFYYR
jgi:hypothetical protein